MWRFLGAGLRGNTAYVYIGEKRLPSTTANNVGLNNFLPPWTSDIYSNLSWPAYNEL
jgi:hypothetical protein